MAERNGDVMGGIETVASDDPCPNCGEAFGRREAPSRFGGSLPEMIDGDARVFRNREGVVCFEVSFSCPGCGQDFLAEDLQGGALVAE